MFAGQGVGRALVLKLILTKRCWTGDEREIEVL